MTDPQTPATEAAKKLMMLLAQSQIAWPDEYTFIAISALTPLFVAIEAEARASLDVDVLARALHGSYERDPNMVRIEWTDLNEADRAMWRRHAKEAATRYRAILAETT